MRANFSKKVVKANGNGSIFAIILLVYKNFIEVNLMINLSIS